MPEPKNLDFGASSTAFHHDNLVVLVGRSAQEGQFTALEGTLVNHDEAHHGGIEVDHQLGIGHIQAHMGELRVGKCCHGVACLVSVCSVASHW
jgi:hypothetical protein